YGIGRNNQWQSLVPFTFLFNLTDFYVSAVMIRIYETCHSEHSEESPTKTRHKSFSNPRCFTSFSMTIQNPVKLSFLLAFRLEAEKAPL
ncbi:MAG: hypothetical protein JSW07_20210, partial [bacterium]